MNPIRVVVVDDDPLFAESLALTLAVDPRIALAGIAYDGLDAIHLCRRRRPDVCLMDLHMPGLDGIEATQRIRASLPAVRVVMLTSDDAVSAVADSVDAGAVRFLLKGTSLDDLRDAVVAVAFQQQALPMQAA